MLNKIKVIDTSALLDDPLIINKLENAEIIIPFSVLKELDQKKIKQDEIGRNSREIIRILDGLSGEISTGVEINNNCRLRVFDFYNGSANGKKTDELVIGTAKHFKDSGNEEVTLISQDINMRVRAKSLGIKSEPINDDDIFYLNKDVQENIYSGIGEVELDDTDLTKIEKGSKKADPIDLKKYGKVFKNCSPNQFLLIQNDPSNSTYGMIKFFEDKKYLYPVTNYLYSKSLECKPKNIEQNLAINLMLDDNIHFVSMIGNAGTGKTLLSLVCALYYYKREGRRIIVTKPMVPVGRDLGFLPGDVEEKMAPWMGSIFDNLRLLLPDDNYIKDMMHRGDLSIEPISLFRGRSIPNSIIIVDELQNCSKLETKTIITRAGENTKIFVTADLQQIDNIYTDSINNGATYCVEKFKGHEITGHITLTKGERSKLATLAATVL